MTEKKKFVYGIIFPAIYLFVIWAIKFYEYYEGINLYKFGVLPGNASGLIGILTAPLIHADINHLMSNSLPLLILGSGIIYFYWNSSPYVFLIIYLGSGLLDWLFARPAYHIGSSGLVYGMVTFLFFSGIIRRDTRAITLALLVTFLYGSLIWGVLPIDAGISWETHLFGSLLGIVCAVLFRKADPAKKYEWEYEQESVDENESLP